MKNVLRRFFAIHPDKTIIIHSNGLYKIVGDEQLYCPDQRNCGCEYPDFHTAINRKTKENYEKAMVNMNPRPHTLEDVMKAKNFSKYHEYGNTAIHGRPLYTRTESGACIICFNKKCSCKYSGNTNEAKAF